MFWSHSDDKMKVSTTCFLPAFLLLHLFSSDAEECEKIGDCKCKTASGFVVDLSTAKPLAGDWFIVKDPKSNTTYYFNPCIPLDLYRICQSLSATPKTAVCQDTGPSQFDAGDVDRYVFAGDPSNETMTVTYTADASGIERKSVITLNCEGRSSLEFNGEAPERTYNFVLRSPATCPTPSSKSGLSTGSILVIVFFVFLIVYFIGGVLFMVFVRHASGLEIIPNYEMWKEILKLIRDGFLFTFRGCKRETTYQRI